MTRTILRSMPQEHEAQHGQLHQTTQADSDIGEVALGRVEWWAEKAGALKC